MSPQEKNKKKHNPKSIQSSSPNCDTLDVSVIKIKQLTCPTDAWGGAINTKTNICDHM